MVIRRDGKMVVIKHGGILRNVTKIHITRIQGCDGGTIDGEEVEEREVTYREEENGDVHELNTGNLEEQDDEDRDSREEEVHYRKNNGDRTAIEEHTIP